MVNLFSWIGHFYPITGPPGSPTFLTPDLWSLVHRDVLKQCDGLDGVLDGILEDPTLCQYRPEDLICTPGEKSGCLTGVQANTVRQVLAPMYGEEGELVYPRMQPGTEVQSSTVFYSGQVTQLASVCCIMFFLLLIPLLIPPLQDWYRYVVYDPSFNASSLGPEDWARAARQDPFNISAWNGDLSAFKSRGGKLLHHHGLQDFVVSSEGSNAYYDHVSTTMNLPPASLDDFYRFFRISGMGHCSEGPGAWQIGNTEIGNSGLAPEENVLMAMVQWIEKGKAPESILGKKYVNDDRAQGLSFSRRHCKYPARNVFLGGNSTVPESWGCQ